MNSLKIIIDKNTENIVDYYNQYLNGINLYHKLRGEIFFFALNDKPKSCLCWHEKDHYSVLQIKSYISTDETVSQLWIQNCDITVIVLVTITFRKSAKE